MKIIGLGGAGANMLDRVALDGLEGAEMLALNTDIRTLSGSVASERIQLGRNLTKGLGTGGDPELGHKAVSEAEDEVRVALKGRKIVFVCVGLGGGTGSGAAPIVARIAREEGAFVVMFATMPFVFEGNRRREQAETALNELAVLSNALVTFDNGRMGELVLAKQGIHEAFAAADRMISESIKAVIRLVVRPGLINVGLDDLMTALRTTRSRCLFGSGIARGKDRAQKALRNALASPLLDQGALLEDAQSVLVHLCGGEDLTLFEIELLMESLGKHVPAKAHVLFGAAVDPSMEDQLSITLVSSLPEERLRPKVTEDAPERAKSAAPLQPTMGFDLPEEKALDVSELNISDEMSSEKTETVGLLEAEASDEQAEPVSDELIKGRAESLVDAGNRESASASEGPAFFADPEPESDPAPTKSSRKEDDEPLVGADEGELEEEAEPVDEDDLAEDEAPFAESGESEDGAKQASNEDSNVQSPKEEKTGEDLFSSPSKGSQSELSLDGGPKGRFEGADPSMIDGEDLDVPAFLRKKRS
ncbi:MAG: hypothetical protein ACQKBU_04440 [Verrucomicrobiales bacterium]